MSESRKYTEAQKQSAKKWDAANLDRVSIALPKGRKDDIKAAAVVAGESMNQYIISAVDQRMERDTGGPQEAAGPGVVLSLPSEALKTAQAAAQAAGENLPQFITRAVSAQVQEDVHVRLNAERQKQTAAALVGEIEDTARLVTSTLWCNVFYNGKLYKKPGDAQKVHDALVECKQRISTMLDNLADGIHPATGKRSRKGTTQNGGEAGSAQ